MIYYNFKDKERAKKSNIDFLLQRYFPTNDYCATLLWIGDNLDLVMIDKNKLGANVNRL